jgi:hypothetical protein
MKKIIFALAVLMLAVPAWAEVVVYCEAAGDTVTVKYDATSEPNLVRAVALDVVLDNNSVISDVNCLSEDYYIYPGSIVINAQGQVDNYGSCQCDIAYPGTLGAEPNQMTTEQGSLYAPTGPGSPNAPPKSGDLFSFKVDKGANVSLAENEARGGVVMESPDEVVDVNLCGCAAAAECFPSSDPQYQKWIDVGKPKAWCCPYQDAGDLNGDGYCNPFDLRIFRPAYPSEYGGANYDCRADLNHDGYVNPFDLRIFRPAYPSTFAGPCADEWKDDCGPNP